MENLSISKKSENENFRDDFLNVRLVTDEYKGVGLLRWDVEAGGVPINEATFSVPISSLIKGIEGIATVNDPCITLQVFCYIEDEEAADSECGDDICLLGGKLNIGYEHERLRFEFECYDEYSSQFYKTVNTPELFQLGNTPDEIVQSLKKLLA